MSKVVKVIVGAAMVVAGAVTGNWKLIAAGVSLGLGALMQPKSGNKKRAASAVQVQIGEVPREAIVGKAATAGSLVDAFNYGGKYGTDWEVLVLALADHRCAALEGFYVNDSYVAFGGDGAVAGYNGQLMVWWRPGTEFQTVPSVLTSQGPGWTANDNGAGVCYVTVAYKADAPDAKNPIWTAGRPRFLWIVRGALHYDARKDSSVGGSGAHRRNVPATWEYSENVIVTRYSWVRGFYACDRVGDPNQLLIGRGLSEVEAPPQNVFARANLCDELVGGEPRYRVGGTIAASEPFIAVEEDFATACAGTIVQPEGSVEIDPGEARAIVATFTDRDLVVGSRVRWNNRILSTGSDEWVNTVVASYIEPTQKWAEHAAPVRRDPADLIADRQPREQRLLLGFVTWQAQGGRIGEIWRRLGRLHGRAEVTLPPRFAEIEEGDWVQWQSDRHFRGATLTFRVESWGANEKWHHQLTLRQISASVYSDTAPLDDGSIAYQPPPPPVIGAPVIGAWTLTGGYVAGDGTATPALTVTGGRDDPAARFVRIEYVQGAAVPTPATVWNDTGIAGPDVTRREIAVMAGGTYYAAVSYIVDGIQGDRRVLGPVTVPAFDRGKVFVQSTAPTAAESSPGDTWLDDFGRYWTRRDGIHISIGGKRIMLAGKLLTITWVLNGSQPVGAIAAAAAAAQKVADDATAAAAAANAKLADIASDGLLTPGEKPDVILNVQTITAEQAGIAAQATAFGITTEKTAYDAAVSALTAYLATLTAPVLWNNLSGNTAIIGADFRAKFANVYAARQTLLNKIAAVAKQIADDANSAALAAQSTASAAASNASLANALIAEIASDSLLTPGEKPQVIRDRDVVLAEQAGIVASATAFGITTEKTAYETAVSTLSSYLASLTTPFLWSNMAGNTDIVGSTFRTRFASVYTARQALLDKVAVEAAKRADWSGIVGAGKPEDGADVTANAVPRQEGPTADGFTATSAGVLEPTIQLPRSYTFKRFRGPTDVSASGTTWSIVSQGGITGGTVTVANGIVTVPDTVALPASSTIVVRSTRADGPPIDSQLTLTKTNAPPPSTGGGSGGTSVSDSSFSSVSSTSWVGISDILTVKTGSGGQISLSAPLSVSTARATPLGYFPVELKWMRRPVGGSFSDVSPGAVESDPDCFVYDEGGGDYRVEDGAVTCNRTVSGLTASTDYEVQLYGRRTSGTRTIYFSGTASGVGS